jgi:hypothetical protein
MLARVMLSDTLTVPSPVKRRRPDNSPLTIGAVLKVKVAPSNSNLITDGEKRRFGSWVFLSPKRETGLVTIGKIFGVVWTPLFFEN